MVDELFHGVEKRVFAEEWSQLVGWAKFGAKGNGGSGVVVEHAFIRRTQGRSGCGDKIRRTYQTRTVVNWVLELV